MKHVFLGILALFTLVLSATVYAGSATQGGLKTIFRCENDTAVIYQSVNDPTHYQLVIQNNDINMYLGLGYLARPEGQGAAVSGAETFVGFTQTTPFDAFDPSSPAFRTAHIFPEYGGLKVLVETAAHYYCEYQPLYGEGLGSTHTVVRPLGMACPNLYPSYDFRNAHAGIDHVTSLNWFFQNCRDVQ